MWIIYLIHKGDDKQHRSCADLYIIFPGKGRESKEKNKTYRKESLLAGLMQ